MENSDTLGFADLIESIGRCDSKTNFYRTSYAIQSEIKSDERRRVLDYIISFFPEERIIKILSMPGESWSFERDLITSHPKTQIVGVERYTSVYHRGRRAMPGKSYGDDRLGLQERQVAYGRATLDYTRTMASAPRYPEGSKKWQRKVLESKGFTCLRADERAHRFLLISAETYMTMLSTDYGATMDQKKYFHNRFMRRNSAWLDFTGPLCPSSEEAIANLHWCMEPDALDKPVVITILSARDAYKSVKERLERIFAIAPFITYHSHWTYKGAGGSPMLTVCGYISGRK